MKILTVLLNRELIKKNNQTSAFPLWRANRSSLWDRVCSGSWLWLDLTVPWGPPSSYLSAFLIALLIGLFHLQSMRHLKKKINGCECLTWSLSFLLMTEETWNTGLGDQWSDTPSWESKLTEKERQKSSFLACRWGSTSLWPYHFKGWMDFSFIEKGGQLRCLFKFFIKMSWLASQKKKYYLAQSCWTKENIPLEQTFSIFIMNRLFLKMSVRSSECKRGIGLFPVRGPAQRLACERKVNTSVITPRIACTVCWWQLAYREEETVLKDDGNWCYHKQHVQLKQLRSLKKFQERTRAGPQPGRSVHFPSRVEFVFVLAPWLKTSSEINLVFTDTHFVNLIQFLWALASSRVASS